MNKSLLLLSLLPFALVAGTLEESGSPERDSLRVRFLGTGAADWNGRDARGELRRWTSALLDGRVLVDYTATNADMIPADAHPKTVFYTHSHADHYDPDAALRLGVRQVYVNASWVEGARREFAAAAERLGLPAPDVRGLAFGESAAAEGILLTSLPANHVTDRDGEHCSMYLVEKGDVRLLYATDTGGIPGEAARIAGIDAHVRPGRPITALIMEATMGVAHADDFRIYSHSSVATVAQTLRVLQTTKRYLPVPDQKVYLTHMARTLHGTQREIAAALPEPFTPAFDGLEVTFASPRSETERIQGEIDRVSAQGGGRVVIGKGVHPCGTLYLKSGVELHLEEGVTLEDFGHMTFRNITVDSDGPIGISGNSTSLVRDMTLDGISGTIRADPPVVSRRTQGLEVMRKTVSRLAKMPAAESREAERAPYEVSWNGNVLWQQDARISSVPHNRVWPGHQRELSQTEIARFVRFDHEVAGTLEIRGDGVGRLLRHVLPLSEKASVSTEGDDGICIAISRPGAHVVEFDGLPTLHVFADPPLAPVPAPGPGGRLIRFERGEHSPGVVAPRSGDVVVLDEGAVVYGSLFVLNATNVTVTGRGIFDGSRLERSDETMRAFRRAHRLPEIDTESACFAYSVYGSEDVAISGVTFRDPPFWTLVIRNQCRRTLVDNIHIIGNWRYNSDGIDVCASRDTVIRNSFFRTFDDCVIARGPYLKGEYAPVDGMVVTNCSLYCDWGMPFKAQVQDFRGSTIQNVCMRDCRILAMRENGILLAVRYGSDLNVLRNFTFEDLEFDFFPQPYSSLQKTDGEAFVPKPMMYNTLVLSYSYSLGKNLDNQVNGPMEDPGYYHFIYEDLAFRRFKTFGEKRTLDVCLLAKVPRHEYRRVTIEDLPPFKRVGPETVWSNVVSSVEGRTGER